MSDAEKPQARKDPPPEKAEPAEPSATDDADDEPSKAEPEADVPEDADMPEGMEALPEGHPLEKTEPSRCASEGKRPVASWKTWAFAAVPLVGVVELGMHLYQTRDVVPEADWKAARELVRGQLKPDDLVVFAPQWSDPLGREYFGDEIASIAREARPDETRFARAFEVSIRGKHRDELRLWRRVNEQRAGAVTVTTFENPAPAKVIDDLLSHAGPEGMSVSRVDNGREVECPWGRGATQSGGLWFGPAIPGDKFSCSGSFVGVSVLHALDHSARRCFYVPPSGGVIRMRFANVGFGQVLHGHHGLQHEAERSGTGAPVTLVFRAGDRTLGKVTHLDGTGWTGFELPTSELAGQRGELVVDVSSSGGRRHYCFEADTR